MRDSVWVVLASLLCLCSRRGRSWHREPAVQARRGEARGKSVAVSPVLFDWSFRDSGGMCGVAAPALLVVLSWVVDWCLCMRLSELRLLCPSQCQ